jgi:Transient receptor potential (TRP) ion channel
MVIAAIIVAMLLFKVILELWARCGHLSPRFETMRTDYWRVIWTTMVRIILIVYGTWALYCLFQFRDGDSWAAAVIAGITLGLFTGILIFFTVRIFYLASKARKLDGGLDELYEHEPWMRKYGYFYDQFKSRLFWFFVPILILSLVRSVFLVFGAGSGMVQAIGILAAEGIFLFVLFWRRPYDGRGANVVNALIAVVRVLSIVCILIFVQELGIANS